MKDVLLGKIDINKLRPEAHPARKFESFYVTTTELEEMREALRFVLNENPPVSLNEIARRLGRTVQTFKHYFPEIACLVKERYSAYEAERFNKEKIKASLLAAINENPPPSLNTVAKRLCCSRGFLRDKFPKDISIIVNRHIEFRTVFADVDDIRAQFQALQTEFPPLSIIQCSERLGCTRINLYKYFPDVCRVIGVRYSEYRMENARQRRLSRHQAIINTKLALEAEQIPASHYHIRKRLPNIESLTNREIDSALNDSSADHK